MNLLQNPSFDGPAYEKAPGEWIPEGWGDWYLNNAYGPRREPGVEKSLKPEFSKITPEPPYLDPPRTLSPGAMKLFKIFGTMTAALYQQVSVTPGNVYRFSYHAHAWALSNDDPFDPHCSTGVGCEAFFALEGESGLSDGERNFRFRAGIDPTGGADPQAATVQWGDGAHIYNVYHEVPAVEVEAQADTITCFVWYDNLWGMKNSDAYLDECSLELVGQPPQPCRGLPREQYARRYYLLPQPYIGQLDWVEAIVNAVGNTAPTIGYSADDAGIGDLDVKEVVAINPALWPGDLRAFYQQHYPGAIYKPVVAATPADLERILGGGVVSFATRAAAYVTKAIPDVEDLYR